MGFVKDARKKFRKIFSTSEEVPVQDGNKVIPGTQEEKRDIGKEVFERTGHLREGIAQSSTRVSRQNVVPQDESIKSHGTRNRQRSFEKRDEKKNDC